MRAMKDRFSRPLSDPCRPPLKPRGQDTLASRKIRPEFGTSAPDMKFDDPLGTVANLTQALAIGAHKKASGIWFDHSTGGYEQFRVYNRALSAAEVKEIYLLNGRDNVPGQYENWPLWTVVNLVAIASYWQATMAFTAFLYGIYLVLGLLGWREWWRAMKGATPARG